LRKTNLQKEDRLVARIAQLELFSWEEIEDLGDLHRLRLVLEAMPDEGLMRVLERERGRGRNDYPVRAVWNSILAGVVFQHVSIESLRRELERNGQLRQVCGFSALRGADGVPAAYVYTRFLKRLMAYQAEIDAMFDGLVKSLRKALPGFGRTLAIDGKGIRTHGRKDPEASWGRKTYRGEDRDGTAWERVAKWFGYKLHLVVDAEHELPVAYEVTRASWNEMPQAHRLVQEMDRRIPEVLEGCEAWLGDKGYDDGTLLADLWDEHGIKPVVAIRDCWQDGEETRWVSGTENVVYDAEGTVYCHCPLTGERRAMAYGGFEKKRDTLKYRCPARHYGCACKGSACCPVKGAVRIKLSEDRRIFTPVARSSYAWKRVYKKRTAVERVNSRLDVSFGFERHFIRGLQKMKLRCGLALLVMLAMALGRVKEKQKENLRSLVAAA